MQNSFVLSVLALLMLPSFSHAGELPALEKEISRLHRKAMVSPVQAERFKANEELMDVLDEALALDRNLEYPFDSLEGISVLQPKDKQFRMFTWFVREQDGNYLFYGVLQSWNARDKRYDAYWLKDRSNEITEAENALLDAGNWYGALYYEVIPSERRGRTYYTLLGWDGHNPQINRKLIEVLSFRRSGTPVFGYYLFRDEKQRMRRVLFEYSGQASMALRYDEQSFIEKKRIRNRKIKEKTVKDNMIVFDRLVPLEPALKGNPRFTVPEGNIQDAFIFRNGWWKIERDIDARNPATETRPEERKPPEKGLFPPRE